MKLKFTLLTALAVFLTTLGFAQTNIVEAELSSANGYVANAENTFAMTFDQANNDDEWVDSLSITFPDGFTILSVSNDDVFGPGTGDDEVFNGISPDGRTVSWGDNDNDFGGIDPTVYEFTITVSVGAVSGDQTVIFHASGDQFVAPENQADLDGEFTLSEAVVGLPVDYELPPAAYNIVAFGDVVGEIIANPDPSGVNTSGNVFRQIQPATPTNFGGAFVSLDVPADFSSSSLVALDVWVPVPASGTNASVTLRFEVPGNDPAAAGLEETLTPTTTEAWETLVFDFSADLAQVAADFGDVDHVTAVVFFDLGLGNNDQTYYMDNIRIQPLPTIFDIVEGSDVHNTLQFALEASGLDAATSDPAQDLTLFAPTDDAFAAIQSVVDELVLDPTGALTNVLLHHVLAGSVFSTDLSDGLEALTLQGENITVNINGSDVSFTSASGNTANLVVDAFDLEASNGVVHVIDAVLVPGLCTSFDGGPYNDFNTAFGGAPVAVDGVCPFNVLTAFQSWASEGYAIENFAEGTTYTFGLSGGSIGAWDPEFLVLDGTTGAVVASETEGNSITWTSPADGTYICVVQEEGFCGGQSDNLGTDNGFPYITCESSLTITDIVVADENFSTLETAVVTAGLDGALASEGPFTVFAPTNAAFAALDPDFLAQILDDVAGLLTPTLQHHVVPAIAYSTDLFDGQVITTLNEDVTVGIDGTVTITSSLAGGNVATVTATDIIASNGVIHVIDAVLTPTVLSVDQLSSVTTLNVYPNPTNNQFSVDINLNTTERVTIDIVNVLGQVVKSQDLGVRSMGMNREYINVSDLNNGMYFMNITVGDDQGTVKVQIAK